jgi:hypothetical protein
MSHFNFGSVGKPFEIDTRILIDNTGKRKLISSGNAIRVKNNPTLLWNHHTRIAMRPLMNKSIIYAREYLSKKILAEVDEMVKANKL